MMQIIVHFYRQFTLLIKVFSKKLMLVFLGFSYLTDLKNQDYNYSNVYFLKKN